MPNFKAFTLSLESLESKTNFNLKLGDTVSSLSVGHFSREQLSFIFKNNKDLINQIQHTRNQ